MEWEDLMQEGYLVFMRCEARYPILDTPQHFMALFKRSWINEFTDMAKRDSAIKAEVSTSHDSDEDHAPTFTPIGDTDNDGLLAIKLRQAPREVTMVLSLFLNAPTEMLDAVLKDWNGLDGRRHDGGSSKICAALGLPAGQNIMAKVHDYFRST